MTNGLGVAVFGLIGSGLIYAAVVAVQRRTIKNTDGEVVPPDVQGLAAAAGVDPDVYALARVCASEAGGCKRIAKVAVACVVVNHANALGKTPLESVLGTAQTFGPQGTGGRSYVASSKDPGSIDLDVAADVAAGNVDDPTGGALNFDSPDAYKDKLDAAGNLLMTAEQRADAFAVARQGEGKVLVLVDGVSEGTFRFWRKA